MKLFKRTRAAVLCAVMAAALILPAGVRAEEGGAGRQAAKVLSWIRLSVGDGQETPVFKAGEETELRIKVANKGNLDAQNVSIAPVVENTDDWPFDMEKLSYEQELGSIEAGKDVTAVWGSGSDRLKVREDVTGKSYKLVFRLTYDDGPIRRGTRRDMHREMEETAQEIIRTAALEGALSTIVSLWRREAVREAPETDQSRG